MCYLTTSYFDIASIVDEWNVSVDRWWSVTDRKTEVLGENLVPLPLYPSRQRKKNIPIYIYMCVCIYIFVCVCVNICVYAYVYIHVRICTCVCVCVCIYIYIYTFFEHFYLGVRNPLSVVVDKQNITLQDAFHDFIALYSLARNVGSFFEVRT